MSIVHQPLDQVYSSLSAAQQQAVRKLLLERFAPQVGKLLRAQLPASITEGAIVRVGWEKKFVSGAVDPGPMLAELFRIANETHCNSIFQLCTELLSTRYSIADESEPSVRKLALQITQELHDTMRQAFPELDWQQLLAAIQADRREIDSRAATEVKPRRPKGTEGLH